MRKKLEYRSIKLHFDQSKSYFEIGNIENKKTKYYLTDFGEGRQVTRWGAQNLLFSFMIMLFDGYLRSERVDLNDLWENYLYDSTDEIEGDRKPDNPLKRGIKILKDSVFVDRIDDLSIFTIEGKHNYSFKNGDDKQLNTYFLNISIDGAGKNGEPLEEWEMMYDYFVQQWGESLYIDALKKKNAEIIRYFDEHIDDYEIESNLNYWYKWRPLLAKEKFDELSLKKNIYEKQKDINDSLFPIVRLREPNDESFPTLEGYIRDRLRNSGTRVLVSLVTGDGGGGKSFGLINAQNSMYDFEKDTFFVFVPAFALREFKPNEDPVFSFITDRYIEAYTKWNRKITKREAFLNCISGKKIVLIVDGIDEISSDYYPYIGETIREIAEVIREIKQEGRDTDIQTKAYIIISMRDSKVFLNSSRLGLEEEISIEEIQLQRLSQVNFDRLGITSPAIRKVISENDMFQTPLFIQMFMEIDEETKKNRTTNLKKHYINDVAWEKYKDVELRFESEWEVFMAWNSIMSAHAQRNKTRENIAYSMEDVYKWLLPLVSYQIIEDDQLKDKGIPASYFGEKLSNFILKYETLLDREGARLPEGGRQEIKALVNTGIIRESNIAGEYEYRHNKYNKFFAAKFVLDAVTHDTEYGKRGSLGKAMLEKLISGTRYYKERGHELDRAAKLTYMEYATYAFDMICKIVKKKNPGLKKDLLLLGLNIGYEDTFDVWDEVIGLVEWYKKDGKKLCDEKTSERILVGINSFLYSYLPKEGGKHAEEILPYYEWLNNEVSTLGEKAILFRTLVSSNLGACYLQLAKVYETKNDYRKRDKYLGIIKNENGKYEVLPDSAVGRHIVVREEREKLYKMIQEGSKGSIKGMDGDDISVEEIPLSKAYTNLATDYYWKSVWLENDSELDMKEKVKLLEDSIEWHKKALELQGIKITIPKNNKLLLKKSNKKNKEIAPIDGKSYMILRRIAGNYRAISLIETFEGREKYIRRQFYILKAAYEELKSEIQTEDGVWNGAMVRINSKEIGELYKDVVGKAKGHENLFNLLKKSDKKFSLELKELTLNVRELYDLVK